MNIFDKVTLETLKKNRTRTIVTIIGIMLSTALICAVTTSVSSFVDFGRRYFAYEAGTWHGQAKDQPYSAFEMISASEKVDKAVFSKYEGYAPVENSDIYKPYLYLMGVGEGYEEMMPIHMKEGHFPENDSEILLPAFLSESGGVYWSTGDKIVLDVGERIRDGRAVGQESSMFEMGSEYPVYSITDVDEEFSFRTKKEYTVCGIYDCPDQIIDSRYEEAGYTSIVLATDSEYIPDTYKIYFSMNDPDDVYDFMKEKGLSGKTNRDLLLFYGTVRYSTFKRMILGLTAIVIALIMFGSVMLIYNAFSISVSERTKQFGLLSSIGATKKQLRKMVGFESLAVSMVGIPSGIILGIAGMWVTFACIGGKFSYALGTSLPDEVNMKLSVSALSVIAAAAVALITVMISAWRPSRRATKVTAVEAIRQNTDIKARKKKIRTPKIVYRLFGISGMLGHKYFKRSKKRYRSTIVSLFLSIVLFVSASSVTDYMVRSVGIASETSKYELEYELFAASDLESETMELYDRFSRAESVDKISYVYELSVFCDADKSLFDSGMIDLIKKSGLSTMYTPSEDKINVFVVVSFVDDDTFMQLLDENGLSREKFMGDEPLGLAYDGEELFDMESGRYVKAKAIVSDECTFDSYYHKNIDGYWFEEDNSDGTATYRNDYNEELRVPFEHCRSEYSISTGKTIHDLPFFTGSSGIIEAVLPISAIDKLWGETWKELEMDYARFVINSSTPDKCEREIREILKEMQLSTESLHNIASAEKQERSLVTIVKVFAYGFIVIISLIAAANVFNTISTNIGLRRREFAMLRSIGMTAKGIRKILNYECILYGAKSLISGLPVSVAVTYIIFRAVDISMDVGFYIPWKAVVIASFSVFAVVFVTMMYSMSKLKKDNTIDALKNENL